MAEPRIKVTLVFSNGQVGEDGKVVKDRMTLWVEESELKETTKKWEFWFKNVIHDKTWHLFEVLKG